MNHDHDATEDMRKIEVLADAISKAIGDNTNNKRFFDLSKIPLICLNITGMNKTLDEIKEMIMKDRESSNQQHESFLTKESFNLQFEPVKSVVYGGVSIALLALAGAIIALVSK